VGIVKTTTIIATILYITVASASAQKARNQKTDNQPDSINRKITVLFHHGIVVPHHTAMSYLINDYSRGAEIKYTQQTLKSGSWQSYFNYPETGIALFYNTFGNTQIYGEGFALYPYINFPIIRSQLVALNYKVALGLAYATKPFDIETNPYNTVFGSHFNAFVGFGLNLDIRLTPQLSVNSGFALNHMSNGSTKKPNNGINTSTLTLGASWHMNGNIDKVLPKQTAPADHTREILFIASAGSNQVAPYNTKRYLSGSVSLSHMWYTTTTKAYGVGIDVIRYGGAPFAYQNFQYIDENKTYHFNDFFYSSIFAAYHVQMGKTTMFFNIGAYIYQHTKPRQPVYPRVGIRYRITPNLLGSFGIKANFFSAEFLEFGLGYRLPYKK
jgi:hypothetical protein